MLLILSTYVIYGLYNTDVTTHLFKEFLKTLLGTIDIMMNLRQ